MTGYIPKLRILLIMRDAPDTQANKGGLFPTAIRHHVELGFDVHVASVTPMEVYHEGVIRSLGATPYAPSGRTAAAKLRTWLHRGSGSPAELASSPSLARISAEIAPDVVTGIQSYHTGLIARDIAQALGVPYITWEHLSSYARGSPLRVPDSEIAALFNWSHAVLAVSPSLGQSIRTRFSIKLDNLKILPNPIPAGFTDLPEGPPPGWLREVPKGCFLFASWTTWRQIKRLDVLLDAFASVFEMQPNISLIVAGTLRSEAQAAKIAFQAHHPGAARNVLFVGDVDRQSVRHLAEAADCCVVSSDVETFGLQMAEAIALGTPVVSTRCGGTEDVLSDTRLGLLCDRGNPEALAAVMCTMLETQAFFNAVEIARIADELLGQNAIKVKWADVYADLPLAESGGS